MTHEEEKALSDVEFLDWVTFTKLRLCGCGIPENIIELFRDTLRAQQDRHGQGKAVSDIVAAWSAFEKTVGDERLVWLVLYMLADADLTEHGGSARAGWLTSRGERYLALLEQRGCEPGWGARDIG
jgi:hypothetical protein